MFMERIKNEFAVVKKIQMDFIILSSVELSNQNMENVKRKLPREYHF